MNYYHVSISQLHSFMSNFRRDSIRVTKIHGHNYTWAETLGELTYGHRLSSRPTDTVAASPTFTAAAMQAIHSNYFKTDLYKDAKFMKITGTLVLDLKHSGFL